MCEFVVCDRKVTVYASDLSDRPIVYLNNFDDSGNEIFCLIKEKYHDDFSFVVISNLDWNNDMSPWSIPPIFKNDTPCTGGADLYLKILTEEIIPQVENEIIKSVSYRALAGYSLAGLFALYSLYKTDIFSQAASISGSLWYPNFKDFVFENEMKKRPDFLYFSLGDTECRTKNPYLKTVQKNTEEIEKFYKGKGVNTFYKLNQGNHYNNASERMADGILYVLKR